MKSTGGRAAIAALAMLASGRGVAAEEVSYTHEVPLQLTVWGEDVEFARFDPVQGILRSVKVELVTDLLATISFENLDPEPAMVTVEMGAEARVSTPGSRPGGRPLARATMGASLSQGAGAYDGELDFAGRSGGNMPDFLDSVSAVTDFPDPSAIEALPFVGPAGEPGTIMLLLEALGTCVSVGSGNVHTVCMNSMSARVTLTYSFDPDCNANGVPDDEDIATGTSPDADTNGVPDECECGAIATYCTPTPNSTGSPALMSWLGSSSVEADDLVLVASSLPPGDQALFIYSPDAIEVPMGNGNLCVGSQSLGQVVIMASGPIEPSGILRHRIENTLPSHPSGLITPYSTWYFQAWFRDSTGGGAGFDYSDGLRVHFCP